MVKEKRVAEDEMVEQHHQLNGHEFEQTLGDGEGQRSLACCSPWGHRVRHNLVTEQQQKIMKQQLFFQDLSQVCLYLLFKKEQSEN